MKKLNFQFGGMAELLTKEEMKKISGGYSDDPSCDWEWAITPGCAGQYGDTHSEVVCEPGQTIEKCQEGADNNCDTNDCCAGVDCT